MTLADIIGYLTIPCTENKHGPCVDKNCTCWCHDEFVAGLFKRPDAGFESDGKFDKPIPVERWT